MKLIEIKQVGVAGAGTMGHGIALNFALWGYPTLLHDLTDDLLAKAADRIHLALDAFVKEKLITRKQATVGLKNITLTTDLSRFAACDFITEAITESVEEKRKLFNQLDDLCPRRTIIASNTSILLLSDFASEVKRQDKVCITHYFVPPHIVPGVEVVKGPGTSDETFNLAYDLMKKINKVPVRVLKEQPGSLLGRLQNALRREAYRAWAEGIASEEDIDLGVRTTFGFRSIHEGPMLHYDLSGVWRWPRDVRLGMLARQLEKDPGLSPEAIEKLKQRLADGKPWLIDPSEFDKVTEEIQRKYICCLKEFYWAKED